MPAYEIDAAMLGSEFQPPEKSLERAYLRALAEYCTEQGFPATAIIDSYNGAQGAEIPEHIWNAAISWADAQFAESFWR